MTPRRGAVAVGTSGVMYLLLNPITIEWRSVNSDCEEACWECLKLCPSSIGPGRDDTVCQIREQWLIDDAEELA